MHMNNLLLALGQYFGVGNHMTFVQINFSKGNRKFRVGQNDKTGRTVDNNDRIPIRAQVSTMTPATNFIIANGNAKWLYLIKANLADHHHRPP